jgi:hypothetical protein
MRRHVVNLADEPIGRQPFGHRIGFQKSPIDLVWGGFEYPVKADCAVGHAQFLR